MSPFLAGVISVDGFLLGLRLTGVETLFDFFPFIGFFVLSSFLHLDTVSTCAVSDVAEFRIGSVICLRRWIL